MTQNPQSYTYTLRGGRGTLLNPRRRHNFHKKLPQQRRRVRARGQLERELEAALEP